MKILVINSGSSSIKFKLISMENYQTIASGLVEKIGEDIGHVDIKSQNIHNQYKKNIKDHQDGINIIFSYLIRNGDINGDFSDLDAIGHRVVHGGNISKPVLINKDVINKIIKVSSLAPLHNLAHLAGINAAIALTPDTPQIAVFDTAFHQTLPDYAYMYALPYDYYKRLHVRKYGFHGTSHQYVCNEAAKYLNKPIENCSFISLHLGNGASVAAIKNGKCIDTSMGLTPLEGLVMGTRSGDIDPAIIYYVTKQDRLSLDDMDNILNTKSGLKGICGFNDMREIEEYTKNGDEKSKLALNMFIYRIIKYIGSYYVLLDNLDAIIFTGGIGENSSYVRENICENLKNLNLHICKNKNTLRTDGDIELNTKDSKVKILKIPTNEELAIAKLTRDLLITQSSSK